MKIDTNCKAVHEIKVLECRSDSVLIQSDDGAWFRLCVGDTYKVNFELKVNT